MYCGPVSQILPIKLRSHCRNCCMFFHDGIIKTDLAGESEFVGMNHRARKCGATAFKNVRCKVFECGEQHIGASNKNSRVPEIRAIGQFAGPGGIRLFDEGLNLMESISRACQIQVSKLGRGSCWRNGHRYYSPQLRCRSCFCNCSCKALAIGDVMVSWHDTKARCGTLQSLRAQRSNTNCCGSVARFGFKNQF